MKYVLLRSRGSGDLRARRRNHNVVAISSMFGQTLTLVSKTCEA